MADPLSIAISVAGLLATAGKICSVLSHFIGAATDAPQSAQAALNAVEEVRFALDMVKGLIDTITNLPSARRMLVRLDHIAITFSNCVLTLSELESLVSFKDGIMHRLRWAWGEKKIMRLLPRLESQKASLSLMVTVLLCRSEMEALESRERLNKAVEQILQRDEEFAVYIRSQADIPTMEGRSVRFHDNDSVVTSRRLPGMLIGTPDPVSNSALLTTATPLSGSETSSQGSLASRGEFETILEESRVYSRAQSHDSDISFTSSAVRSRAWSMLSLNDISIIAVFRLPITLDDINAFGPGLTFATLLHKDLVPGVPNSQQVQVEVLRGPPAPPTAETLAVPRRKIDVDRGKSLVPGLSLWYPLKVYPPPAATFKFVVVGDGSTEKTEALIAYTTNKYPSEDVPTVFDNYVVTVMIDYEPYTLGLFDTAGKEDDSRLRPLAYPQTDVFLVFARIGMASTYQNAEEKWIPEITHHCPRVPFIIVGIGSHDDDALLERAGKQELPTEPRAYTAMGENIAKKLGAVMYVECNIFTQKGLKNVFDEAIVAALEPPTKGRKGRRRSWRPGFLKTLRETKEE